MPAGPVRTYALLVFAFNSDLPDVRPGRRGQVAGRSPRSAGTRPGLNGHVPAAPTCNPTPASGPTRCAGAMVRHRVPEPASSGSLACCIEAGPVPTTRTRCLETNLTFAPRGPLDGPEVGWPVGDHTMAGCSRSRASGVRDDLRCLGLGRLPASATRGGGQAARMRMGCCRGFQLPGGRFFLRSGYRA